MESFVHDIPPSTAEVFRHNFFNMATLGNKDFVKYQQTLEQIGGAFAEDETHGSKVFDEIRSWLRMAPLKDIEVAGELPVILGGGCTTSKSTSCSGGGHYTSASSVSPPTAKKKFASSKSKLNTSTSSTSKKRSPSPAQSRSNTGEQQAHEEATSGAAPVPDKNLVAWLRRLLEDEQQKDIKNRCPPCCNEGDEDRFKFKHMLLTSMAVSTAEGAGDDGNGAAGPKTSGNNKKEQNKGGNAGAGGTGNAAAGKKQAETSKEMNNANSPSPEMASSQSSLSKYRKNGMAGAGEVEAPAQVEKDAAAGEKGSKKAGSVPPPRTSKDANATCTAPAQSPPVAAVTGKNATNTAASYQQQQAQLQSPTTARKGQTQPAVATSPATTPPQPPFEPATSPPPPAQRQASTTTSNNKKKNGNSCKPLTEKQKRIQQQLEEEALLKQELLRAKQEKQNLEQKKREEDRRKRLEDSKAMKQAEKFVRSAKKWFYSDDPKCGGAKDRSTYEEIRNNTPAALQGNGQQPANTNLNENRTNNNPASSNNTSSTTSGTCNNNVGNCANGTGNNNGANNINANNNNVNGGGNDNTSNNNTSVHGGAQTNNASAKNNNNGNAAAGTSNKNNNSNNNKGDVRFARMKFDKWFDEYFLTKAFPEDLRSVLKKGKVQDQQETEVWYDEDEFENNVAGNSKHGGGAASSSSSSPKGDSPSSVRDAENGESDHDTEDNDGEGDSSQGGPGRGDGGGGNADHGCTSGGNDNNDEVENEEQDHSSGSSTSPRSARDCDGYEINSESGEVPAPFHTANDENDDDELNCDPNLESSSEINYPVQHHQYNNNTSAGGAGAPDAGNYNSQPSSYLGPPSTMTDTTTSSSSCTTENGEMLGRSTTSAPGELAAGEGVLNGPRAVGKEAANRNFVEQTRSRVEDGGGVVGKKNITTGAGSGAGGRGHNKNTGNYTEGCTTTSGVNNSGTGSGTNKKSSSKSTSKSGGSCKKKRKYDPHADPEKVGTLGFTDKSKCRKTLLAEAAKEERGEKADLFWDLYTRMYLPKAAKVQR